MGSLGIIRLRQLKYVIFDLETTGFSKDNNRIIQIAAIKTDGGRIPQSLKSEIAKVEPKSHFKNERVFNAFINPGVPVPDRITQITGITNSMIENAPNEEVVLNDFFDFVGDRILVAHNGIRFDVPFIEVAARRSGLSYENFLCLDTLWLSRKLYPSEKKHSISALLDRFDIRKKYSKKFIEQQHNALVDVVLTSEVLYRFIKDLENIDKDQLLII